MRATLLCVMCVRTHAFTSALISASMWCVCVCVCSHIYICRGIQRVGNVPFLPVGYLRTCPRNVARQCCVAHWHTVRRAFTSSILNTYHTLFAAAQWLTSLYVCIMVIGWEQMDSIPEGISKWEDMKHHGHHFRLYCLHCNPVTMLNIHHIKVIMVLCVFFIIPEIRFIRKQIWSSRMFVVAHRRHIFGQVLIKKITNFVWTSKYILSCRRWSWLVARPHAQYAPSYDRICLICIEYQLWRKKKLTEHRTHKPMRQCLRIPSPPMLLKLSPSLTSPLCVPYQFSVSIVCITSRFSTEILFCRLTQKTNKEMTHNALLHFDPFGETQCWSDTSHTPNSFSYPVCCVAIYFDFLSSYLPTMSFGFVAWSGMLCSGDIYNDSGCLIRCDRLSFNR